MVRRLCRGLYGVALSLLLAGIVYCWFVYLWPTGAVKSTKTSVSKLEGGTQTLAISTWLKNGSRTGLSGLHSTETYGLDSTETYGLDSTETSGKAEVINPGCMYRKLAKYVAQNTKTRYHHPPVVHYAKIATGKATLNFRDYIAMMSAYKFLKPERILIHAYGDVVGKYWDLTQTWKGTSVQVNKVQRVSRLSGKSVSLPQHQADYIKLRGLLEHGGVISDFDVVVINGTRLKEKQLISECVLSGEGEYINVGFNSCIKNSSFIHRWLTQGYEKDYRPHLWIHNSAFVPTNILEDKTISECYNMHIDNTICVHPNAGKDKMLWLKQGGVKWRSKTAAHYFQHAGLSYDSEEVLGKDYSLAELFKFVYNA